MTELTCMFTGHRELPRDTARLEAALERSIAELYGRGARDFLCGGAIGFDMLAAEVVLALRRQVLDARLVLLLPCRNHDRFFSARDKERLRELIERADRVTYVSEQYHAGCMHERNRALVAGADVCVCWFVKSGTGTAYTVRHAAERGLEIINLAGESPSFPV